MRWRKSFYVYMYEYIYSAGTIKPNSHDPYIEGNNNKTKLCWETEAIELTSLRLYRHTSWPHASRISAENYYITLQVRHIYIISFVQTHITYV